MEHDEIMHKMIECKTSDQLKELKDFIMYDRNLSLGNKQFYFRKIDAYKKFIPLVNEMRKRGIKYTTNLL